MEVLEPTKACSFTTLLNFADSSDLKITSVRESDSGEVTCVASNDKGELSHTARLEVVSTTTIVKGPEPEEVKRLGEWVRLPCDVVYDTTTGDTLSVEWMKGKDQIMADDLKYVVDPTDKSLRINDLHHHDEGKKMN